MATERAAQQSIPTSSDHEIEEDANGEKRMLLVVEPLNTSALEGEDMDEIDSPQQLASRIQKGQSKSTDRPTEKQNEPDQRASMDKAIEDQLAKIKRIKEMTQNALKASDDILKIYSDAQESSIERMEFSKINNLGYEMKRYASSKHSRQGSKMSQADKSSNRKKQVGDTLEPPSAEKDPQQNKEFLLKNLEDHKIENTTIWVKVANNDAA